MCYRLTACCWFFSTLAACKVDGDSGGSGDLFLYADSIKDTMPKWNSLSHSMNRNDTN